MMICGNLSHRDVKEIRKKEEHVMTRYKFSKWSGLVVILALLILVCPMPANANAEAVSIADVTVGSGEIVTLPINITGVTDLGSATIWLSYDKDVVTVDSVADGDMGTVTAAIFNDDGVTKMIWYKAVGVSGDYVFANVTLHAATTSVGLSSPLNLEVIECVDISFNPITPSVTNGTFTISGAPPSQPAIAFRPSSLSFSAIQGGDNPQGQILEIWNSGPGTLDWSVSDDADWLALAPTNGSSTGEKDEVTISVDIAGMSAGDYSATITIAAAGATNTPRTLAVSLTLTETEAPTIAFGPASLSFSAVAGEANPANKTLEIWNSGTDTLDWSVSDDATWLALAPTSGSSSGEHDVVTASVDMAGMAAGSYPATITITATGATNTPRTASVSLYISDGSDGIAKSVATATDTGTAFFVPSQGVIEQLASVDEATLPEEGKPDLEFPHGFFSFSIVGCTPGDEVEVRITLPDSVSPDTQYWKCYDNEWQQIPINIDANDDKVIIVTLVDGGLGDADGIADGIIVDPGGPGNPSPDDDGGHPISKAAIVALSIAAGAAIIVGIILLVRRRRRSVMK
jgi:hypothetical protein